MILFLSLDKTTDCSYDWLSFLLVQFILFWRLKHLISARCLSSAALTFFLSQPKPSCRTNGRNQLEQEQNRVFWPKRTSGHFWGTLTNRTGSPHGGSPQSEPQRREVLLRFGPWMVRSARWFRAAESGERSRAGRPDFRPKSTQNRRNNQQNFPKSRDNNYNIHKKCIKLNNILKIKYNNLLWRTLRTYLMCICLIPVTKCFIFDDVLWRKALWTDVELSCWNVLLK